MDTERFKLLMSLFECCADLPERERRAIIDESCADDPTLRAELIAMLEHDDASGEADRPASVVRSIIDSAMIDAIDHHSVPERIGPYVIIRELGRGGMGVVYEAQQEHPRRRVAIKVVPGLGSSEQRRRLTQEAQALALIETPGVARVYETGTAEVFGSRTPYIAMELVEGEQIDDWVREQRLSVEDRLRLIARVADAVQAAHSRGVVHRDLKPGNIKVVPDRAGPGQPKVLDFGIAHLRGAGLTLQTMTAPGSGPIGTLQYMSPEQFDTQRSPIDARSDIYALGAVGYTILAGLEPYDMRDATLASAARLISEQDPKPLGAIDRSLRGDIEIVIAKAMSRSPDRRYQTMEAFGSDLRRIVSRQPVQARPPSVPYLFARFVQRNTALSASATLIALLIVVSFFWIGRERGRAIAESQTSAAVSAFLVDMLRSIEPNTAQGEDVTVREVLDNAIDRLDEGELRDQPETNARLRLVIAQVQQALGRYDEAIEQTEIAMEMLESVHGEHHLQVTRAIEQLAQIETLAGRYEDAERHFLLASERLGRAGRREVILSSDGSLGHVYYWTGRYDESERFFRDAIEQLGDTDPAEDPRIGHALSSLGSVLEYQGKLDEAIEAHRAGVDAQIAYYGDEHTEAAEAYNDYGNTLVVAGRFQEALDAHQRALEIRSKLLDPRHPEMAVTMNNLALVLVRMGESDRAIPMLEDAIDIRMGSIGLEHPATCSSLGNLARAYMETDRLDDALSAFDRAVAAAERTVGETHPMSIVFRANRADCLARLGRFEEAEPAMLAEHEKAVATLGAHHFRTRTIARQVRAMYERMGRDDLVARWDSILNEQP
jgi:tetratricopeptide (TPR) repeat protein/predicted Ser/Thr protein kinase